MKALPARAERAAALSLKQIARLLARQESSGLSLAAFGRREGIPFERLAHYRRRRRLARSPQQPDSSAALPAGFVRVEPPDASAQPGVVADSSAVFIHCPGGARLEVHAGFDRALVLDLVRLLQAPSQAPVHV